MFVSVERGLQKYFHSFNDYVNWQVGFHWTMLNTVFYWIDIIIHMLRVPLI